MSLSTNTLTFSLLTPNTVQNSTTNVTVNVDTNGAGGATVYAYDTNSGLSSSNGYTIPSASGDLTSASEGYGLKATSVTQTSGGPMETISPYNGSGSIVGLLDTTKRSVFDSSAAPVTGGQGVFQLKAKSSNTTKAATDYSDIITVIASATF